MMISPEFQSQSMSEEDTYLWLQDRAVDHEPGYRQTDHDLPEPFWDLADKVAEQKEVTQEDSDRLSALYESWQNELNAAEVEEDSE